MTKGISYFISALFMVFVLIFMIYTGFRYFYRPIETEVAYEATAANREKLKAVFIREEEILPVLKPDGVFDYAVSDGDVVIERTVIADTYENEDALYNKARAEKLSVEIDSLTTASKATSSLKGIEGLSSQINKAVGNVVKDADKRDLSKLSDTYETLNFLLAKRYVMNGGRDLPLKISELKMERDGYLESFAPKEKIKSGKAGYFSSSTDGLESTITPEILKDCTFESLENLLAVCGEGKKTDSIGKVMKDHNWYSLVITDVKKEDNLEVGEKVSLDFKAKNCRDIPAEVVKIVYNDQKTLMAVIMKSNRINEGILSERMTDVIVSSKSFTGYKVSKNALRFIDDVEGVYVVEGGTASFKKVNVIYESENYVLCASGMGDDYLSLFDEIIVKGTDIHDGKLIETV